MKSICSLLSARCFVLSPTRFPAPSGSWPRSCTAPDCASWNVRFRISTSPAMKSLSTTVAQISVGKSQTCGKAHVCATQRFFAYI